MGAPAIKAALGGAPVATLHLCGPSSGNRLLTTRAPCLPPCRQHGSATAPHTRRDELGHCLPTQLGQVLGNAAHELRRRDINNGLRLAPAILQSAQPGIVWAGGNARSGPAV